MKRQGFTLVELLVVIAIIALLMGILMPALSRVRQLAFRLTCGTNLSGIGKAMLIYSNDYEDELPKAGGRKNTWSNQIQAWDGITRRAAFGTGTSTSNTPGQVTVTSNFYLLVKYAEVTPKQFVCKGETDTREFKLSEVGEPPNRPDFELIDAWDFGPWNRNEKPSEYCSYSYHHPFNQYALTVSSSPTMAVAADRNPWIPTPVSPESFADFMPDEDQIALYTNGTSDTARIGNSKAHQGDGQNVLFLDSHVNFEKRCYVGTENDNIYTRATNNTFTSGSQKDLKGTEVQVYGTQDPLNRKDSWLIQESEDAAGGGGRPR